MSRRQFDEPEEEIVDIDWGETEWEDDDEWREDEEWDDEEDDWA